MRPTISFEPFPVSSPPVAAGEHCYGPSDGAALRAAGVDVWQPDAVFCGGFDALRSFLAGAAANRALSAPHGGGLLPALHAAVGGALVWLIEYHLLLEPRRQAHLSTPTTPRFGEGSSRLAPPTMPGWGGPLHAAVRGGHDG
jgi:L-alanine-DL-glutamate epimerase-like enolase superfamily enzyme